MKRKLDENDAPTLVAEKEDSFSTEASFSALGLDSRLLQAIAHQKYKEPTLVQRQAIPLALDGKDVIVRAKTGSGKTAAYVLPILQSILKRKQTDSSPRTTALILVPTRELADQVDKVIRSFTSFCAKDVQSVKLTDKHSAAVQRSLLSNFPDVVVSTPARTWTNLSNGSLTLDNLMFLVLDEADLVLSYGYQEDLQNVAKSIPKGVQTILTSATLTPEVETLKGLFCRNPVLLNLVEQEAEGEGVSQYYVKCAEDEKFLLIYVIYKLRLIKGKSIIFVDNVDRCYRLKLFFEQFGIRSCILNSELPVNSRIHVVEEFNKNVYDIIIASDENEVLGDEDGLVERDDTQEKDDGKSKNGVAEADKGTNSETPKKKQKRSRRDKEYGVSRGIDFKNVALIVNFDLPRSPKSYTHRIGRTARAGQTGMAMSFVIPTDKYRKHIPTTVESSEHDEKVLGRILRAQEKKGKEVKPYAFDMKQVEAFRYRMNDALRAVTKVAVREARTRELRQELLKSAKLQRHFEENPQELHHLRHDGELRAARTQDHLKHVPGYLLPKDGNRTLAEGESVFEAAEEERRGGRRKDKGHGGRRAGGRPGGKPGGKLGGRMIKSGKRKADPLKSFKVRRNK